LENHEEQQQDPAQLFKTVTPSAQSVLMVLMEQT
jgi:hypothetical protein